MRRPGPARPGLGAATGALAALGAAAGLAGCGGPDVTRPRLERAVTGAYAPLYAQQQGLLGRRVAPAATRAAASCDRGGPARADVGPGPDWACTLVWDDAAGRPATAVYEVEVRADGCYRATGPPSVVGQQQLPLPGGSTAVNPVYAFDGCFRTS